MTEQSLFLAAEQDTEALGQVLADILRLGPVLQSAVVIYLEGQLGAGKTTVSRGLIQALGQTGAVKSPTYTLVEPYELDMGSVFHFDLYRLADPSELDYLGFEDYFSEGFLCLVEWPDRGEGSLPAADLHLKLVPEGEGRRAILASGTERGEQILENFAQSSNMSENES